MTIRDEDVLPVCNFCEASYDPYDRHTCAGNSIPARRKINVTTFGDDQPRFIAGMTIEEEDAKWCPSCGALPCREHALVGLTRQQIGEALDADRALEMPLDKFADTVRVPGYESLEAVLFDAYQQAATGKGAARHGRGVRFDEQPTQAISTLLGTDAGLAFQAMKKINEGMRLEPAAKIKELLGAINYIASIIIHMGNTNGG